jgi:alanyl-tRNA synthetase
MIFGGSAGLKAMWQTILKNLSKSKSKKISKFFPKMSAEERTLTKLGEKLDPTAFKAFNAREKDLKLEGIEHIIARLKQDKEMMKQVAANKAMKDEGLDFLMKHFEKSEMYPKYLNKYTDIDKDILQMETIKKNLIMKDRKLNAEGGRVSLSAGGLAGMLGE